MAESTEEAWAHKFSESKRTITTTRSDRRGTTTTTQEADREETVEVDATRQTAMNQLHVAALDEVVSVNSFFTVAVFIGLSLNATQQTSLVSACVAGPDVAKNLVVHEVTAFSCYLFSTLVAQGLKLQMTLSSLAVRHNGHSKNAHENPHRHLSPHFLRLGMILSALSSIVGTIFLMLSMVGVVQIRLGLISCNSLWAKKAVIPLLTLVSTVVLVYLRRPCKTKAVSIHELQLVQHGVFGQH